MFKRLWRWVKSQFRPNPLPPVIVTPPDTTPDTSTGSPRVGGLFVDISHHKTIDWDKFNFSDCIMKATEHVSHVDRKFRRFQKECKARGVRHGFYHYYRVQYDPIAQAEHFINTVGADNLKECYHLPVIDLEEIGNGNKDDLIKAIPKVAEFAKHVTQTTGRKCRIYSGDYLMGVFADEFRANGMHYICAEPWIARYPNTPKNFAPWDNFWGHQYSETGSVEWSDDHIDMNRFNNV